VTGTLAQRRENGHQNGPCTRRAVFQIGDARGRPRDLPRPRPQPRGFYRCPPHTATRAPSARGLRPLCGKSTTGWGSKAGAAGTRAAGPRRSSGGSRPVAKQGARFPRKKMSKGQIPNPPHFSRKKRLFAPQPKARGPMDRGLPHRAGLPGSGRRPRDRAAQERLGRGSGGHPASVGKKFRQLLGGVAGFSVIGSRPPFSTLRGGLPPWYDR